MTSRPSLSELQSWMLAMITHPEGVQSGADEWVRPSATLSAAARLATYHRAYHARLFEAFHDMFPALRRAAGDELLNAFVAAYLEADPPRGFTLSDAAVSFPDYLEATRPPGDETWPDFLIEFAKLELAVLEVAEGPGLEGRPAPDVRVLLAASPEELDRARLVPSPCLRLFRCRWPVHRYVEAVRSGAAGAELELPAARESSFALVRREYRAALHDLSPAQYAFLTGAGPAPETGNLRDWLCQWAALGFFASTTLERGR